SATPATLTRRAVLGRVSTSWSTRTAEAGSRRAAGLVSPFLVSRRRRAPAGAGDGGPDPYRRSRRTPEGSGALPGTSGGELAGGVHNAGRLRRRLVRRG